MHRSAAASALVLVLAAGPCVRPAAGAPPDREAQSAIVAAKKGSAQAQYELGERYDLGRGVPQDYREAAKWYRRAADQGHAAAQFALAEMYKNGDGVPKDVAAAVQWYRRAADQGHAGAQLLLGVLYESGLGVTADLAQAATWYRRSAARGDARGQLLLGNLYQLGQGVPKSVVVAYALYTVSDAADPRGNPAAGHRARMAQAMSAEEVAAGGGLAAELSRPGNFDAALDRYLAKR